LWLILRALPPNPIRRDQPAQRLRHNGCKKAEVWAREVILNLVNVYIDMS